MKKSHQKRKAGVLLHISSLPNADLGDDAYRFLDFLTHIGASVWQTLPLNVPMSDGSPYQCLSAHAGNPRFISLQQLTSIDLLSTDDLEHFSHHSTDEHKQALLAKSYGLIDQDKNSQAYKDYKKFCRKHASWLSKFAVFCVLREQFNQKSWNNWPKIYKHCEIQTFNLLKKQHAHAINVIKFTQFIFFTQWLALKKAANQKGIAMFGDIPIFVAMDSADVWANQHLFKLDKNCNMKVVAGVPPDYFSETGQRWGNPHYNWRAMKRDDFKWWLNRMATQNSLFDMVRIDHFRGLESAWEIPAANETAMQGTWMLAPGNALLGAIKYRFKKMCLVAEDLGIITDEVNALRHKYGLPGMKILQFAFGGDDTNGYLPHNIEPNSVVYTGTHDNDTSLGWYLSLDNHTKNHLHRVLENIAPNEGLNDVTNEGLNGGMNETPSMPDDLISMALNSPANLAIIPLQDIMGLDSAARMNTPGTMGQNWQWRFEWLELSEQHISHIKSAIKISNRMPTHTLFEQNTKADTQDFTNAT